MRTAMVTRILSRSLTATASISSPRRGRRGRDDLQRARRYNREKERLLLISLAVSLIVSGLAVITGFPARVRDRITARLGNGWLGQSAVIAAYGVASWVASIPLSYYGGYVIEHRYGLSTQSRRSWFWDQFKGLNVGLVLEVPIAHVVLAVIRRWPARWWAVLSGLSIPFTVILAQLAPVVIAPLFNRYEPLRDRALAERLKRLAARSGISVADVLQMDMSRQTLKANAFFTGLGHTKRIVLADTLLGEFEPREIEVVVAHEIAHQAHRDIWRLIAVGTVFTAVLSSAIDRVASRAIARYGERLAVHRLDDVAALPLLSWFLSLAAVSLTPIQNAYSRRIERRADDYALRLSDDPRAFVRAMDSLARLNLADPDPPKLIKYAFYSHPPIRERIEQARRYAADRARIR